MSIRKVNLEVSGNATISLASITYTDSIPIYRIVETWSIIFATSTPLVDPIITIQGSNDGTNWTSAYGISTTLTAAVSNTSNGIDSVNATRFPFEQMRVKINMPQELNDINIYQFQKIQEIIENEKDEFAKHYKTG